jgi:hypothetical protein
MKNLEVIETITVCSAYVPALFYGDLSGFENSEEYQALVEIIEYIGTRTLDVVEGSENFSQCDISKLKGDTVELNILDWR